MKHRRTEIVQHSTAAWTCRCKCGHETVRFSSKRDAVRAHEVHETWPDGPTSEAAT